MRGKNTTKKIPSSKYKRKPSMKRKPSTKRKPNKKHAHVGGHGATSQKNEKKGGDRKRVNVVAAVWGHGGIVSRGEPGYVYRPPDGTELNLIAFKPQGCSVWTNALHLSDLDALIAEKVANEEDVAGVVHRMTDLHNATVAEAQATGRQEAMDATTTDHGHTIFGVSRDYGRLKTKGNKFYTPYGASGTLVLLDETGYNPHDTVLVRLYLVESPDGVVHKFRTPIPYTTWAVAPWRTTEHHTSTVSGVQPPFTSDLLFPGPIVTLEQIVSGIKTVVSQLPSVSPLDEITVNLVDNNCNAHSQPGVWGEDVISSPIEREMEDV